MPEPTENDAPAGKARGSEAGGSKAGGGEAAGSEAAGAPANREAIYAAKEIRPPTIEANSFGGGLDAADSPPAAEDVPGHGSAHDDDGWRAIEPAKP